MNRKKLLIAGVLVIATLLLLVAAHRAPGRPAASNTEPEGEILRMVTFSGDGKLSALLAPPQLAAAKLEISKYIHDRLGSGIHSAVIRSTVLQDDGSIAVKVMAGGDRFDAVVRSGDLQFVFQVPASGYRTTTSQAAITNGYSGGNY